MNTRLGLFISAAFVAYSAMTASAFAATVAAGEAAQPETTISDIVVYAERHSENLQETPIAVTALMPDDLKAQRIDTGVNLATTVPNMNFQPGAFGKPNFSIRGIGYQLVTTTGDAGVAVHENDGPIQSGRIAQADFFDVEQVEVLRGPQGTLYGRNATGGVVDIITAKPKDTFGASLTGEYGSYNTFKGQGYINVPLGSMLALRVAGDYSRHDGYVTNVFNNDHINGSNIYSIRTTLAFKPSDRFNAYVMWEGFRQNDSGGGNAGTGSNACVRDPGPTTIGGVAVTDPTTRNLLSFGCSLHTNIYAPGAVGGTLNGVGTFGNRLAFLLFGASGDLFTNNPVLTSPYQADIDQDPFNHTQNDLGQAFAEWKVTDTLKLSSLTTFDRDASQYGGGGLRSVTSLPAFIGSITDPQINNGLSLNKYTSAGYVTLYTREYSEELRLQSSFSGPVNFSVGGFYLNVRKYDDVFVFDNINSFLGPFVGAKADPNNEFNAFGGHAYFQSLNPYKLTSWAGFGEVYWQITPEVKLTGGFRYTSDHKTFFNNTSGANLLAPGFGFVFTTPQTVTFNVPTGRVNLDWAPKLSFTDSTLLYASYSRGYKAGGFNPPNLPGIPPAYQPEFVDAFEIGTKNDLFGRTLTLDLTAFYYNYQGYQFTQAAIFGTLTSNVNAHIYGVEFESVWKPVADLALNAQIGYLNTKIQAGPTASSINQDDPTAGNPNLTAVKSLLGYCLVNTAGLAHLISDIQNGVDTAGGTRVPNGFDFGNAPTTNGVCPGSRLQVDVGNPLVPAVLGTDGNYGLNPSGVGVPQSIAGNRLPNVPDWTVAIGAQYTFHLSDMWSLTPRGDFRYTGGQFSDLFNNPNVYVRAHGSANFTVTLANEHGDFTVQGFAKNVGSQGRIIGAALGGGAITGDENIVVIADPTTYGVSVSKRF